MGIATTPETIPQTPSDNGYFPGDELAVPAIPKGHHAHLATKVNAIDHQHYQFQILQSSLAQHAQLIALPTHTAFLDPVAFQNTFYGSPIVPRGQSGHHALLHCLLQFPVFPFLSKKSGGLFSPIYLAPFKTVLLVSGRDANDQNLLQRGDPAFTRHVTHLILSLLG
jgi:hypothetical protein